MVEDVWMKKPKPINVWNEYEHKNLKYYEVQGMDDWLAEVKSEHGEIERSMKRFRKAADDLGEYAADLYDKLEVAKKLLDAAPDPELLDIGDGKRRCGLFLIQLRAALKGEK